MILLYFTANHCEMKTTLKVPPHISKMIKVLCKAIKERRLLYFYYESDSSGKKEWREIRPYMIIPRDKDNLELVGLRSEQLKTGDRQPGHYYLTKLDMEKLKILDEKFDDPGVPGDIVVNTKNPVVCRFIYDDENEKEVKKSWIKIEEITT